MTCKANTCSCGYEKETCDTNCCGGARCGCSGMREHDDECDCTLCLKMGMTYLREQVATLQKANECCKEPQPGSAECRHAAVEAIDVATLSASTQPAIETIRQAIEDEDWSQVHAALAAVEADLRRKEEALAEVDHICSTRRTGIHMDGTSQYPNPAIAQIAGIVRAALAPMSPSEPGTQQAEDVAS